VVAEFSSMGAGSPHPDKRPTEKTAWTSRKTSSVKINAVVATSDNQKKSVVFCKRSGARKTIWHPVARYSQVLRPMLRGRLLKNETFAHAA
jgi:hypothetical protein